jgi:hypothetical protein
MPKTLMNLVERIKTAWYCSHRGCRTKRPCFPGDEVPPGWTVAHVEEHGQKTVRSFYLYLCPEHTIATASRQTRLF